MFTCGVCRETRDNDLRVPQSSKGCECISELCNQCLVHDWCTRAAYCQAIYREDDPTKDGILFPDGSMNVLASSVNQFNEKNNTTHNLNNVFYLFLELLDHQSFVEYNALSQSCPELHDYIKERIFLSKKCPFCNCQAFWSLTDRPYFKENGRLQFFAPKFKNVQELTGGDLVFDPPADPES